MPILNPSPFDFVLRLEDYYLVNIPPSSALAAAIDLTRKLHRQASASDSVSQVTCGADEDTELLPAVTVSVSYFNPSESVWLSRFLSVGST
mgnify:CR=1 FL=1